MLAAGQRLDTDRAKRFSDRLESLYADPFKKAKKPMSAAEIKEYIRGKIRKLRKKRD